METLFLEKNIVSRLTRNIKSDIYCSGVQILNPYIINRITKPCDDFKKLWSQLIKKENFTYRTICHQSGSLLIRLMI